MRTVILLLCGCFFLLNGFSQHIKVTLTPYQQTLPNEVVKTFRDFSTWTYTVDIDESSNESVLELDFDGQKRMFVNRRDRNINSAAALVRSQDDSVSFLSAIRHFNADSNMARFSFARDFIMGTYRIGEESFMLEQVRNLTSAGSGNVVIIYNTRDVISTGLRCAVDEAAERAQAPLPQQGVQPATAGICRTIDYAIAVDYTSFEKHGRSIEQTSNHILGIMNLVEGVFVGVFADDLYFKVSELVIFTSPNVNPWTPTSDIDLNLSRFAGWAPTGFSRPFDLASYWFGQSTSWAIGMAYLGTVCSTSGARTNAISEYSLTNLQIMRGLVAHEIGHNLGCGHTNGFIMNPSVSESASWAPESIATINGTLAGSRSACLTPCTQTPCENVPTPIVNLTSNGSQLLVSWGPSNTPTRVEYRKSPTGNYTVLGTYSSPVSTASIAHNPNCNIAEYFQIRVSNICPNNGMGVSTVVVKQAIGGAPPSQRVRITASSITICSGESVTFTAASDAPTASYQWKLNGLNVGTNAATYSSSSLKQGDIISCQVTATSGCFNPVVETSNSITMTVTPIVADFRYTKHGLAVNFQQNSSCAISYNWQLGDGTTSSVANPARTYAGNGLYEVCLTASRPGESNRKCERIPVFSSWTEGFNAATDGDQRQVSFTKSYCDGEAYFSGTTSSDRDYPVVRYKRNAWIPNEGTLEFLVNVQNGYTARNGNSNTSALIFSVDSLSPIHSSAIFAYANGNIIFRRYNDAANAFTDVTVVGTPFRFNEWHVVSVSYGSAGTVIRVDGVTYTTIASINYALSKGDGFLGGVNYFQGNGSFGVFGFKGYVDKFRMSYTQSDWQLSLANQPPTASITASQSSICAGASVVFTASTNAPTANYQWKKNGVNVGTNAPTYSDNSLVNGASITCVITATSGCFSVPTATSNALAITVSSPVTPAVQISASRTNPCQGESVTFTAQGTNAGTTPVYQWRRNGTAVGTGPQYITSSLVNGDIITCVMTGSLGCVTSATATSNGITMNVRPKLVPEARITASETNICAGTEVKFTAATNVVNPVYQWRINGNPVGTNSNRFTSTALVQGDQVTCTVSAPASDCYTVYTVGSNPLTMTVRPLLVPSVTIQGNDADNILCAEQAVLLTATVQNAGSIPVYQWKRNGTTIGGNVSSLEVSRPGNGDRYTCVLTSSEACVTAREVEAVPMVLDVVELNPVILRTGNKLSVTTVRPGASWQWYQDGQPIAGVTSSSYLASGFGSYSVLETYRTCSKMSNPVSLDPISGSSSQVVVVYPNPSTGVLFAQASSADVVIKSLRLYDQTGRLVFVKTFPDVNLLQVDISNLPGATYTAVLETNQTLVRTKIVRQ